MPNLRQPTRYDEMLDYIRQLAMDLPQEQRDEMVKLADCWNTYDKTQILNGPAVADADSPMKQAEGVIAWKCSGGPRPNWLRSITDEELVCS